MSIKILLADDSITIQKVIGIIFGGEDYSLAVVDNGKAAVDKALEIVPDILLIDALMPGMSGYEVCERIRSIPALAAKPILLLTGSFEPFDESKAKSCGADDFIAKPFESQQIILKVTELCERAAARTIETAPELLTIAPTPAAPFMEQVPMPLPIQESVARSNDIWDAFTPEEPAPESIFQSVNAAGVIGTALPEFEPSSFPWVPVDDQAISFEENTVEAESPSPFSEPLAQECLAFDEISFATEIEHVTAQPEAEVISAAQEMSSNFFSATDESSVSFTSAPPQISNLQETALEDVVSIDEAIVPAATIPVPANLTEDQLRAAILGVSKDVIERLGWEVVPDLAESMIKEAIRRIREGM